LEKTTLSFLAERKGFDLLLEIWTKVVRETSHFQIESGDKKGLIKNPVINDFYPRETAFAAKIFATEYRRTKNVAYLQRAIQALDALQFLMNSCPAHSGLNEPVWTPEGVKFRTGSIPASILLLYAIDETCRLIPYNFTYSLEEVLKFLELCYLGEGKFTHDRKNSTIKNQKSVVNTTSMAYFFLQLAKSKGVKSIFYREEIDNVELAIQRAQRADGFFSYVHPDRFQKTIFQMRFFLPSFFIKAYNKIRGDDSIFFGDAIHHTIVVYYFLLGKVKLSLSLNPHEKRMVTAAFNFLKNNFVTLKDNSIMFDFSWEPKPERLRYCNFIDTSTYFYILALLKHLQDFNILTKDEREKYTLGLLSYIRNYLLTDSVPCIKPYQGGETFRKRIIPRPSETVFDKGFLLSGLVDELILE